MRALFYGQMTGQRKMQEIEAWDRSHNIRQTLTSTKVYYPTGFEVLKSLVDFFLGLMFSLFSFCFLS